MPSMYWPQAKGQIRSLYLTSWFLTNKLAYRGELSRKEGGNIHQGEVGAGEEKLVRACHCESLSRTGS